MQLIRRTCGGALIGPIKKAAAENSREVYILDDSSKFDRALLVAEVASGQGS